MIEDRIWREGERERERERGRQGVGGDAGGQIPISLLRVNW